MKYYDLLQLISKKSVKNIKSKITLYYFTPIYYS